MISNKEIQLRAVEAEDLDIIYQWENISEEWLSGGNITPFSRKQIWDYVNNYDGDIFQAHQLRLMIEPINESNSAHNPVGMIDIYDFDPVNRRGGVGIFVSPTQRNCGYGLSALNLLCNYCYERIGMQQLYALIAVDNQPSIALFKGAGFNLSGHLKDWLRRGEKYINANILQKILSNNT